jgi:hypothetical protein
MNMPTKLHQVNHQLVYVMEEIFTGHQNDAVVFDAEDVSLLAILHDLTPEEASRPAAGYCIAAHAYHVSFSIEAYKKALQTSDPSYISDNWPQWEGLTVSEREWREIREQIEVQVADFLQILEKIDGSGNSRHLRFALGGLAHMAFHLGAMRVKYDVLKNGRAELA